MVEADRELFAKLVREALANLHDGRFLRSHPLNRLLGDADSNSDPEPMQRLLLDAIEELRPPVSTQPDSSRWRMYRYVHGRYVDAARLDRLADDLAIGERQARRYNHEGTEAIISLLWARYSRQHLLRGGSHATQNPMGSSPALVTSAEMKRKGGPTVPNGPNAERTLESELAYLARAAPGGPTPLAETFGGALAMVAKLLNGPQTDFTVALPADLPPVAVHRVVLRQIFLGVLVYAIDRPAMTRVKVNGASHEELVVVRVAVELLSDVESATDDAGADLPHTDLDAIRHLVKLHNGHLTERLFVRGEEITIELPVSRFLNVLLIDDNPDFLRLFERFLDGSAYRVTHAGASDDPIQRVVDEWPDAIVLDVLMPTQDGWEILQSLKANPSTRDIPVIVCSVLQDATLAHALGAAASLVKPVNRRELLAALDQCCPYPVSVGQAPGGSRDPSADSASPPP